MPVKRKSNKKPMKKVNKKGNRKIVKKPIKKLTKPKKKMNKFFEAMLSAKKNKEPEFEYKGNIYTGHEHKHLGMIYKKK